MPSLFSVLFVDKAHILWSGDLLLQNVEQNGVHWSRFQIVGLPDFRSHSKSRPSATQPLLDHLKSRLGRISDPNFTTFHTYKATQGSCVLMYNEVEEGGRRVCTLHGGWLVGERGV